MRLSTAAAPPVERKTSTWWKSVSGGSFQDSVTDRSPGVATTARTSPGGFRSGAEVGGAEPLGGGEPLDGRAEPCGAKAIVSDDDAGTALPEASRAVNVTVVVPSGKLDGASVLTVACVSTRSTARAAARNAEIDGSVRGSAPAATSPSAFGTVRRGGVVSTTVTVKAPAAV